MPIPPGGIFGAFSSSGMSVIITEVVSMSAATEDRYDLIVVSITARSSVEIDQMIELCALLKENRHSRVCPLAVFLPTFHQEHPS